MLSHLRFHRRGPASNPTSPAPDQPPVSPLSANNSPFTPDAASPPDALPPSSASSSLPPTLPPIARVTSDDDHAGGESSEQAGPAGDARVPQPARSPYRPDSGFIGGVALENYRRDLKAQQSRKSTDNASNSSPEEHHFRARPVPVPGIQNPPPRPAPRTTSYTRSDQSPSVHADTSQTPGTQPTGRRQPAWGNAAEQPPGPTIHPVEPQKGKKGLPFLKNPMSTLLMRRKTNQNAPDIAPLPLNKESTYDPRIKGTRVHDFSAPRRKAHVVFTDSGTDQASLQPSINEESSLQPDYTQNYLRRESTQDSSQSSISATGYGSNQESFGARVEQLPPEEETTLERGDSLSRVNEVDSTHTNEGLMRSMGSYKTTRSRKLSDLSTRDTISSLPRHMKSTSSRFSFDMIGAAKQEKIMEDRHRQRQLEKGEPEDNGRRDSRFDEFDDDAFDYDAMMDDDGLEERIPGVNADYDEDELYMDDGLEEPIPEIDMGYEEDIPGMNQPQDEALDPDNDQENFAGFVFQRSNPNSSLASPFSPGLLPTPRDAEGNVIGSALTKDTPTLPNFIPSPQGMPPNLDADLSQKFSDLGIQKHSGDNVTLLQHSGDPNASQQRQALDPATEDDMYFDDGLLGYEDEFAEDLAAEIDPNAEPFDESIFDNDDTDEYGRPVPGAFAQAQSLRRAVQRSVNKRESDMTSRLSAQSGISRSTAHTSFSAGVPEGTMEEHKKVISPIGRNSSANGPSRSRDSMAAYQAALAAAAHKAAASGKFQRSSSPVLQDIAEQNFDDDGPINDGLEDELDEYNQSYENMDDFELDDDAIIAEANASALANDSDGWYGQEFGFYAAPLAQGHGSYSSSLSSTSEFNYANGGFFGPKGELARSTSGRLISREPNLTPITERSEYSNRNSIMSMGLPPMVSGTPTLQSPGLAQLAMMSEQDGEMTLSALLRLRSKAWGGSQASLSSSRDGSPRSERGELPSSPWAYNPGIGPLGMSVPQVRQNSGLTNEERDSDAGSAPASPTVTMANVAPATGPSMYSSSPGDSTNPMRGNSAPSTYPAAGRHWGQSESAPVSAAPGTGSTQFGWGQDIPQLPARAVSLSQHGKGHRRQKSSTDSISYIIEDDGGEPRWVMERRRTGDHGEVETIEREFVEGGRI
ncbi:hypothetical protein K4F52_007884 [Lecanicillium sp. MT-2017a]|nr:hypothetical protein K4F52_007884 [Lecanicillium sp. MT-2017a]